ncbi:MAG TPA: phosphoglucomutase [Lachnospiraceae bacterium]|nr:phosphoglucomutase [Lachnospiraceae bacterium]
MEYMQKYESWINNTYFDEETRAELKGIANDEKEIKERFYKDLEFGTGGLRGIIGAGTNRMNQYTVGKATQGLANYLMSKANNGKALSVAIAYDSRNMSPEFAQKAGLVLAANGIKAYVFCELRPTPELSFAVRQLGCDGGIVITASHNPPEYNGYKVYGDDGGQVTYPRDEAIIAEVNKIQDYADVKCISLEEAENKGLYQLIGAEIDDAYMAKLKEQSLNGDIIKKVADDLKIVYTPLHGTGNMPVRRILKEIGFKNVFVVPEQELPDKNFSTVSYPNPEDPKVFKLALEIAKKVDADVIVGTDPDADRVGVVVKNNDGEYIVLTGNMTGALLTEYVLSQKKAKGLLKENGAVIKTIVTTEMIRPIAENYGVKVFDVLTGFKYIGEKIKEFEQTGCNVYEFGFEESYGCLAGTYARDKDAVVATMLVAELTAFYKAQGITIYDGLMALYKKYGYYREGIKSITLKGIEGVEKIQYIMEELRKNPPTEFVGTKVEWNRDYKKKTFSNLLTGETEENLLPPSNVLHYTLADGAWVCVRPSGTEPKIKIYYGVKGTSISDSEEKVNEIEEYVSRLIDNL